MEERKKNSPLFPFWLVLTAFLPQVLNMFDQLVFYSNPVIAPMEISVFQDLIQRRYGQKDSERGVAKTFMWLIEEVGELASAMKEEDKEQIEKELADVIAWTFSLANLLRLDVEEILRKKYGDGNES
jgi:NTP pyrophosphatase (non-canonical NTP hydrolase)